MIIQTVQLLTAGAMAGSLNSNGIHMNKYNDATIVNGAIQAVFTGSPAGTLSLQISCDNVAVPSYANGSGNPNSANPSSNVVNWATYTGSPQTVSGAGIFIWNFFNPGYRWLRCVWVPTGGTGSLTVNAVLKGVITG